MEVALCFKLLDAGHLVAGSAIVTRNLGFYDHSRTHFIRDTEVRCLSYLFLAGQFVLEIRLGLFARLEAKGVSLHLVFGDLGLDMPGFSLQGEGTARAGGDAKSASDTAVCIQDRMIVLHGQGLHLAAVYTGLTTCADLRIKGGHKGR